MNSLFGGIPLDDLPEHRPWNPGAVADAWAAIDDNHKIVSIRFLCDVNDQLQHECDPDHSDAPSMPSWIVAAYRAFPLLFDHAVYFGEISAEDLGPHLQAKIVAAVRATGYRVPVDNGKKAPGAAIIEGAAAAIAARWAEIVESTLDMLAQLGRACPGSIDENGVFFPHARLPADLAQLPDNVGVFATLLFRQRARDKERGLDVSTLALRAERELLSHGWCPSIWSSNLIYAPALADDLLRGMPDDCPEFSSHERLEIMKKFHRFNPQLP